MDRFILHQSKGLAEMTRGKSPTAQFIHESVRDYLRETGFKSLAPEFEGNLPGLTHDYLKQCCQRFVSERVLEHLALPQDLHKAKSNEARAHRDRATRLLPFLEYAVGNLVYHAECARDNAILQAGFVEKFPSSTFGRLSNVLEKYEVHRYSPSVTAAYLFAEKAAPHLLNAALQREVTLSTSAGRHLTVLGAAVSSGNIESVTTVLKCKAMPRLTPDEHKKHISSAVERRVSNGDRDAVKFLIGQGVNVNATFKHYGNALHAACSEGYGTLANILIDSGADANAQGDQYGNALQAACYRGLERTVECLVDKGADIHAQGGRLGNALQAACLHGNRVIVDMLIDRGAEVYVQGGHYGNAFQAACNSGCEKVVELLIQQGVDVNVQGGHYGNALQAACHGVNLKVVEMLVDRGADVSAQGGEYGNALQAACILYNPREEHVLIAKMLIARGANINAQCGMSANALQAARDFGSSRMVQMLLDNGAWSS